jgi:WD40 repeat protein
LRQGHAFLVSGAVLFPDGLTLATAAADDSVRVWDARSGAERRVLSETGRNGIVALSHDAAWLLTGGPDNTAKLWPVAAFGQDGADTLAPMNLVAHGGDVTAAACSPVASLAITGDINGRTVLWNLETREAVWNRRPHNRRINAVQFTPDGKGVLIGSSDNALCRLDVSTGDETGRVTTASPVRAFGITSDGTGVIVADESTSADDKAASTLIVWDPATSVEIRRMGPFDIGVQSIMIAPDNQTMLIAGRDNTIRRLSMADNVVNLPAPLVSVDALYGGLAAAELSHDGDKLLTMNGADARLFDAASGHELLAFRPQDAIADAEFSPDGQTIITASWDGTVRFWNAAQQPPETVATLNAHEDFVNSAVFSPDGKLVLTSSEDRTARLWDAQTRTLVHELKGHAGPVNHAVFSRDGTFVLTVSDDRTARLWDTQTGMQVGEPFQNGHSRPILCAAFSADGQRIATGSEDNLAIVWNIADRSPQAILGGHTASITAIAFSPDNARVFTASADRTAKVWDVSPEGLQFAEHVNERVARAFDLLTLTGHVRDVTSLAISSDGRKLLTGSRDRTAIIWSTSDWSQPPAAQPVAQTPVTISSNQP